MLINHLIVESLKYNVIFIVVICNNNCNNNTPQQQDNIITHGAQRGEN